MSLDSLVKAKAKTACFSCIALPFVSSRSVDLLCTGCSSRQKLKCNLYVSSAGDTPFNHLPALKGVLMFSLAVIIISAPPCSLYGVQTCKRSLVMFVIESTILILKTSAKTQRHNDQYSTKMSTSEGGKLVRNVAKHCLHILWWVACLP